MIGPSFVAQLGKTSGQVHSLVRARTGNNQ